MCDFVTGGKGSPVRASGEEGLVFESVAEIGIIKKIYRELPV